VFTIGMFGSIKTNPWCDSSVHLNKQTLVRFDLNINDTVI